MAESACWNVECGEHWSYPSMTFPMQAQVENFHLGPFPYMGDPGGETYLWWEGTEANTGALGVYSDLAGVYSFVAAFQTRKWRSRYIAGNLSSEISPSGCLPRETAASSHLVNAQKSRGSVSLVFVV